MLNFLYILEQFNLELAGLGAFDEKSFVVIELIFTPKLNLFLLAKYFIFCAKVYHEHVSFPQKLYIP